MTFSLLTLLVGSFLCGWAVLRCMGNERERQVNRLETRIRAELTTTEPPAVEVVPTAKGHQPGKPARG